MSKVQWRSPSKQPKPLPTVLEAPSQSTVRNLGSSVSVSGLSAIAVCPTRSDSPARSERWTTPARSSRKNNTSNRDEAEASPSDSDQSTNSPHRCVASRLSVRRAKELTNTGSADDSCVVERVVDHGQRRLHRNSIKAQQSLTESGTAARPEESERRVRESVSAASCASLRSASAPARTHNQLRRARSRSGSQQRDIHLAPEHASSATREKRTPCLAASGKENVRPASVHTEASRVSYSRSREPRASSSRPRRSCDVLPCNRAFSRKAKNLDSARGPAAKEAFREALVSGAQRPSSVKLGFVGAARAGKTSTLRALAGLPLRIGEESTLGLAVWELYHKLLSARPGKWHLQEARGASSTERWDREIAQFVAERVQKPRESGDLSCSSNCQLLPSAGNEPDEAVLRKLPVNLIANRLGTNGSNEEECKVVLETYDFGGQEVYYAMHHLFLTDNGIYLACIDLSMVQHTADGNADGIGDLMDDEGTTGTEQGWGALEWWLASITISAPNSLVAIVGTHDDCLEPGVRPRVHQLVHQRIVDLCTRIPELNLRLKVNENAQLCFFPIDNSSVDNGRSASALRAAIDDMASNLLAGSLNDEAIPLRWTHFWAALQRATSDDRLGPLCRVEDLWKKCSHYGFESQAELQRFLKHFSRIGVLLNFPDAPSENLRELVCLEPAWIAEAAASVLVAKDRVLQGCTRYSVDLRENGRLHSELLAAIWRPRTFARHQKQLVDLLQVLDLLMPWEKDKVSMPQSQHASAHQVYLVPSLLPLKPRKPQGEPRADTLEEDSIVMYLDFHGLLHRLLPSMFPRVLCAMARIDPAIQILTVYSNFASFALSTRNQAQKDIARSSKNRRQVQNLIVSLQPCAGGEFLRCCLRPHRSGGGGATGSEGSLIARPSWRHADRLLHTFRDALSTWMPRLSFKVGVRCPACSMGRVHCTDLHAILRDEIAVCTRSGEPLEDFPPWLADWRIHLQPSSLEVALPSQSDVDTDADTIRPASKEAPEQATSEGLQLEYLYAAPLDAAPLDIRAELEVLTAMQGLGRVNVRTATTEVLSEVWRATRPKQEHTGLRVLRLATHCAVDASGPAPSSAIVLEDAIGLSHAVAENELSELLTTSPSSASCARTPFDVAILDACNSEHLARCFVRAGASYAVACCGTVFDAAARAFLRTFLRALALEGDDIVAAFLAAQRAVRLSPQPGLRAEAERFRLLCADEESPPGVCSLAERSHTPLPPPQPPPSQNSRATLLFRSTPVPVEDFIGRTRALAEIAQAFLNGRRIVCLHGNAGVGKSALAIEFLRFYGFPGDRLFSAACTIERCGSSDDSERHEMPVVQFTGLHDAAALTKLEETFARVPTSQNAISSRLCLIVLDDVRNYPPEWWKKLDAALKGNKELRLLLTSQDAQYDAPVACKIVVQQVGPLQAEDAALLFLRRIHRPLFQRDISFDDASVIENNSLASVVDVPLSMAGRRREFLQQLSRHPLLVATGYEARATIDAAVKVTPMLPSLYLHPLLLVQSGADIKSNGLCAAIAEGDRSDESLHK